MEKTFDLKYILRIGGILFIICALTALLLAAVNAVTADKIAANSQAKMEASISSIFGDGISAADTELKFDTSVKNVYEVKDDKGDLLGYAVYAVPVGFKGDIEMMVGFTSEGVLKSVEIITMSETPGLGTKVGESAFIDQYKDKSGELVLGTDITAVAGATISSRTVNDAVNEAQEAVGGIIG